MTQKLLGLTPSGATDAATKGYVDTSTTPGNTGLSGGAGSNLSVVAGAGITISSGVALASTVSGAGLTFTSGVVAVTAAAGAGIIVNADDIAVDYGPDPWKKQVRAASTANGTLATAFANGQVIDGVTLATGDRILLKNQTTGSENGIYTVNASGAPTRATDFDATAEAANGCVVEVLTGTINSQTFWNLSNTASPTIGTTALTFSLLESGRDYLLNSYSADRTADNTDNYILVDASAASRTVTLPTAVGRKGQAYFIERTDSTVANSVTVATTSSQTINGASTYVLAALQYAYVEVVSDNSNWIITDESVPKGAWTSFTPTWSGSTGAPTVGNGTYSATYQQIGKTVFFRMAFTWGSTTSGGSGAWGFTLPVAPKDDQAVPVVAVNGGTRYALTAWLNNANGIFRILTSGGTAGIGGSTPFAWASGAELIISGSYEAA